MSGEEEEEESWWRRLCDRVSGLRQITTSAIHQHLRECNWHQPPPQRLAERQRSQPLPNMSETGWKATSSTDKRCTDTSHAR